MVADEFQNLIDHIPNEKDFPNSTLQISIPTTSEIDPASAMSITHKHALPKGWKIENITIIRKSGYIECHDCKKFVHIHIKSPSTNLCMNCSSKNITRTTSEVSVVSEK